MFFRILAGYVRVGKNIIFTGFQIYQAKQKKDLYIYIQNLKIIKEDIWENKIIIGNIIINV